MSKVEENVESQDKGLMVSPKPIRSTQSVASKGQTDGDLILPSLKGLRNSMQLQRQLNQRLQELQTLNHKAKFKSQRGGTNKTIWCKREVP